MTPSEADVERVAKALATCDDENQEWESAFPYWREHCRKLARAAIAAMGQVDRNAVIEEIERHQSARWEELLERTGELREWLERLKSSPPEKVTAPPPNCN